jgi:hypothetical protein
MLYKLYGDIFTPVPATPTPVPLLELTLSSDSPAPGDRFTVDATVEPIPGSFVPWGVIITAGGTRVYSFDLKNPGALIKGKHQLTSGRVAGLRKPYSRRLLDIVVPQSARGTYNIIAGLSYVDITPGKINDTIPYYSGRETAIIQ